MAGPREAVALATSLSPWQREAPSVEAGPALSIRPRPSAGGGRCETSTSFEGGRGEGVFLLFWFLVCPRISLERVWTRQWRLREKKYANIKPQSHLAAQPVISAIGRLRQEDSEFKASLNKLGETWYQNTEWKETLGLR